MWPHHPSRLLPTTTPPFAAAAGAGHAGSMWLLIQAATSSSPGIGTASVDHSKLCGSDVTKRCERCAQQRRRRAASGERRQRGRTPTRTLGSRAACAAGPPCQAWPRLGTLAARPASHGHTPVHRGVPVNTSPHLTAHPTAAARRTTMLTGATTRSDSAMATDAAIPAIPAGVMAVSSHSGGDPCHCWFCLSHVTTSGCGRYDDTATAGCEVAGRAGKRGAHAAFPGRTYAVESAPVALVACSVAHTRR